MNFVEQVVRKHDSLSQKSYYRKYQKLNNEDFKSIMINKQKNKVGLAAALYKKNMNGCAIKLI